MKVQFTQVLISIFRIILIYRQSDGKKSLTQIIGKNTKYRPDNLPGLIICQPLVI